MVALSSISPRGHAAMCDGRPQRPTAHGPRYPATAPTRRYSARGLGAGQATEQRRRAGRSRRARSAPGTGGGCWPRASSPACAACRSRDRSAGRRRHGRRWGRRPARISPASTSPSTSRVIPDRVSIVLSASADIGRCRPSACDEIQQDLVVPGGHPVLGGQVGIEHAHDRRHGSAGSCATHRAPRPQACIRERLHAQSLVDRSTVAHMFRPSGVASDRGRNRSRAVALDRPSSHIGSTVSSYYLETRARPARSAAPAGWAGLVSPSGTRSPGTSC